VALAISKQVVSFDGIVAQADAFCQAVSVFFFCVDAFLLLSPRKLNKDICKGKDNVDSQDKDAIR